MQLSETPTGHLLVRASTDSEWDWCSFAIVHLSDAWKQNQLKRLDTVKPFVDDYTFQSLNFYDWAVDFYHESDDSLPDVNELLADRSCAFVEISEEELDNLKRPENALDCYTIAIESNGEAKYKAYGKHTGEEFWTEGFPLSDILKKDDNSMTTRTISDNPDCEVLGVFISRSLLAEYGYDPNMPTKEQMQIIANEMLEYWGVSDGFEKALACTMKGMLGIELDKTEND